MENNKEFQNSYLESVFNLYAHGVKRAHVRIIVTT